PLLYPHQWSWDSAFIAIGNVHRRPDRAMLELRTLFDAQWANGMVPHIVFSGESGGYFPAAADWNSRSCPSAPDHVATSGICQPPVHALAVELVAAATPDGGEEFLHALYPRLVAWHDYLLRDRAVGSVLAEVWHPWETGMDNSPAWDRPLGAIELGRDDIPEYRRVDLAISDPADRPTDRDYDRYAYLLRRLRSDGYTPKSPESHPFRIRDVLFNAVMVRSERSLASIARRIGHDGDAHDARADELAAAVDRELWSESAAAYRGVDATTGEHCETTVGGDLVVLLAEPPLDRQEQVVDALRDDFFVPAGSTAPIVPTVPIDHSDFEPTRYWRGPSWINVMWLVAEGLERCGEGPLATQVRDGLLALVAESGCFEYFDPVTRRGLGSERFSWTAALAIDTVERCV
ncbi:MAG: glycoside hydrolase, partial [Ilumatobacter sp.]|nr:glycoside hydrolase [Ilumatobacter sp.]